MKTTSLFLNGSYKKNDLLYYQKISENSFRVAVDGGYSFFKQTKQRPDILLGDFDSIDKIPAKLSDQIEIITHPKDKNQTDLELALALVLKRGFDNILVIQPEVGELDHFLGNLLVMLSPAILKKLGKGLSLRIINRAYQFIYLCDQRISFIDCVGDLVSVFPVSAKITLNEKGFKYPADDLKISKGSGYGLRNYITAARAGLEVAGKALIYHKYNRSEAK